MVIKIFQKSKPNNQNPEGKKRKKEAKSQNKDPKKVRFMYKQGPGSNRKC